ncbi:hypothetical protein [Enterococcus rotai]|uniref:hypothetical protein n=1 Tax=Enterococcus rotai TaxID=118060 RepID=UPI0035C6A877
MDTENNSNEPNQNSKAWFEKKRTKGIVAFLGIIGGILGIINTIKPMLEKPSFSISMNNMYAFDKGDDIYFVTNEGARPNKSVDISAKFVMALTDFDMEIIDWFPIYELNNSIKKTGQTQGKVLYAVYNGEKDQFKKTKYNFEEFGADFGEDLSIAGVYNLPENLNGVSDLKLLVYTKIDNKYYLTSETKTIEIDKEKGEEIFEGYEAERDSNLQYKDTPKLYEINKERNYYDKSYWYFIDQYSGNNK